MALKQSDTLRNNRAAELEALLTNGTLEIRSGAQPANVAAAATGTLLCSITLPADCLTAPSSGAVSKNGTWSGTGEAAAGGGTAAGHFRFKTSGGAAVMDGAISQAGAAWQAATAYVIGQYVTNGGNVYVCDQNGTSAGSGGPTGTGSNIADNTARWDYVSAVGEMTLDNVSIASGQTVTVSSFTYTEGNA